MLGMRAQFVIPVLASILILGTLVTGLTPNAYAQPEEKLVIVFITFHNGIPVGNALCQVLDFGLGNFYDAGLTNDGGIVVLSVPANLISTDVQCVTSPPGNFFAKFLPDVSLNPNGATFVPLTFDIIPS